MAVKKKKIFNKKRPKSVYYRVTCYQIQVKGPQRNEALKTLWQGLSEALAKGAPLAKADKFGTVIRCINTMVDPIAKTTVLSLVKYNTTKTGLNWNASKRSLEEDTENDKFSAQRTELIFQLEEHKAYHIHKSHGPTTNEIEDYISTIFSREKQKQSLDCEIDVIPLKIGNEIEKIYKWKTIKKFSLEIIRPNPDGRIEAKQIKQMLKETSSDKIQLDLSTKEKTGLIRKSITPLIEEAQSLVDQGQGRVAAEGLGSNSKKATLDSKNVKTKVEIIKTNEDDNRTLSEIILDYYASNL